MAEITWKNVDGTGMLEASRGLSKTQQMLGNVIADGLNDLGAIGAKINQADLDRQKELKDLNTQSAINKLYNVRSREELDQLRERGVLDTNRSMIETGGRFDPAMFNAALNPTMDQWYNRDRQSRLDTQAVKQYDETRDWNQGVFRFMQGTEQNKERSAQQAAIQQEQATLDKSLQNFLAQQVANGGLSTDMQNRVMQYMAGKVDASAISPLVDKFNNLYKTQISNLAQMQATYGNQQNTQDNLNSSIGLNITGGNLKKFFGNDSNQFIQTVANLAQKESSGNLTARSGKHFGLYQINPDDLYKFGVLTEAAYKKGKSSGNWDAVYKDANSYTEENKDFTTNPEKQNSAFLKYTEQNLGYIAKGLADRGIDINKIPQDVIQKGALVAHNGGWKTGLDYILNGSTNFRDGNGTRAEDYAKLLAQMSSQSSSPAPTENTGALGTGLANTVANMQTARQQANTGAGQQALTTASNQSAATTSDISVSKAVDEFLNAKTSGEAMELVNAAVTKGFGSGASDDDQRKAFALVDYMERLGVDPTDLTNVNLNTIDAVRGRANALKNEYGNAAERAVLLNLGNNTGVTGSLDADKTGGDSNRVNPYLQAATNVALGKDTGDFKTFWDANNPKQMNAQIEDIIAPYVTQQDENSSWYIPFDVNGDDMKKLAKMAIENKMPPAMFDALLKEQGKRSTYVNNKTDKSGKPIFTGAFPFKGSNDYQELSTAIQAYGKSGGALLEKANDVAKKVNNVVKGRTSSVALLQDAMGMTEGNDVNSVVSKALPEFFNQTDPVKNENEQKKNKTSMNFLKKQLADLDALSSYSPPRIDDFSSQEDIKKAQTAEKDREKKLKELRSKPIVISKDLIADITDPEERDILSRYDNIARKLGLTIEIR